jgi:hypothetical protein
MQVPQRNKNRIYPKEYKLAFNRDSSTLVFIVTLNKLAKL